MTAPSNGYAQRVNTLLTSLLDKGYTKAIDPVLSSLSRDPRLVHALSVYNAEALRLEQAGQTFTADNPAYLHLKDTIEQVMQRQTGKIDAAAESLQGQAIQAGQTAARQLALPGVTDQHLATLGFQWNRPDTEAIARLLDYANTPAWSKRLQDYGPNVSDAVNKIALNGVVNGYGPRDIARSVTDAVDAIPRYRAEALVRTLQLQSYRRSTALNYAANADKIEYQIRIAALDDRTCLACIALNGTRLDVGEEVIDHWNGRCTAIPVIKGFAREVQSGEDWLNGISDTRQMKIMGEANYNAYQAGAVTLSDFVAHEHDATFGKMTIEASLKGILGNDAKQYYARNQKSN